VRSGARDRSLLLEVLRSSAFLVGTELATRAVSLLTTLYLARTLARDSVGLVESGLALFLVLQIASGGGIEALFTSEAARRRSAVPRLAGQAIVISWLLLAVLLLGLGTIAVVIGVRRELVTIAVPFSIAAALLPLGLRFVHIADQRAPILGTSLLIAFVVYFTGCVLLVRDPTDALRAGACFAGATVVRVAMLHATYHRHHGGIAFDRHGLGASVRRTVELGVGSGARGLQLALDVLLLGLLAAPGEVGPYALATKLPLLLASFATFVYISLSPTLVRAAAAGERARLAAIQADTLDAVLAIAVPGVVALGMVAEPLAVALFSERYRMAAPILALLLWRVPLLAAGGALRTIIWARDPTADARIATTVLVVTLIGLPIAAARGAQATAWCMLAADGLALALCLWRAERPAFGPAPRALLVRLGAGMAVAAGLARIAVDATPAVAVAGALGAWGVAGLVAGYPHLRRVAREVASDTARRAPSSPSHDV
jgi:O-antigen/teichoic acid export membrane protein